MLLGHMTETMSALCLPGDNRVFLSVVSLSMAFSVSYDNFFSIFWHFLLTKGQDKNGKPCPQKALSRHP